MIPFDASGAFRPVAEGIELRRLAVRGATATLSAAAVLLALRVVPTVVLARLLTPADFGVVAMVTTFSLLLMSFGRSGFSEALIQSEEMNRFQAHAIC
jgi:O-antigen/teichoic acid export membrane protein